MNDFVKEITEFTTSRRNLPHWQSPGSSYFITSRSFEHRIFTNDERMLIFNAIKFHDRKKYILFAAVVMPDHIHLLLKPLPKVAQASSLERVANEISQPATFTSEDACATGCYSLSEIMHSIKSFTAHKIQTNLWQHESFDRLIRNEKEFLEKMQYVVENPIRSGICQDSTSYEWLYYTLQ